jgi:hypothetical protein
VGDEYAAADRSIAPLWAANAHDARGPRPAEIDTAGASGLAEACKSTRPAATPTYVSLPTSGGQASSRACWATVAPQSTPIAGGHRPLNSGSPSTGNPGTPDLQGNQARLTPQKLASNPGSGTSPVQATPILGEISPRQLCVGAEYSSVLGDVSDHPTS